MLLDDYNRPIGRRDIWALLFGGIVGAFLSFYMIGHQVEIPWVAGAFLAGYAIGVILHELGHAISCQLCGGRVLQIELGAKARSKPWLAFRFARFYWRIYSVPFSGKVYGTFYTERFYRLRNCLFILGGPMMNALLLAGGWYASTVPALESWSAEIGAWNVANCLLLYTSLVPFQIYARAGETQNNDVRLFFQVLRYRDADIKVFVESANVARAIATDPSMLDRWSLAELWQKHDESPQNVTYLSCLVAKLNDTDDDRYLDCVLKLMEHPRFSKSRIPSVIDQYLTWQLNRGSPPRPEVTDDLSRKLLDLEDSVSTRGTRGSVLIDLGRVTEGKAMLKGVLSRTESSIDKSYANVFLALAAKSEGNIQLAREHAVEARKIDPAGAALKRVADLLEPNHRRS
jgi:Zn-dependent protease